MPMKSACFGNNFDSTKICGENYVGPLCQSCKKGFTKFFGSDCKKCYSKNISLLTILGFFILSFVVLGVYFK